VETIHHRPTNITRPPMLTRRLFPLSAPKPINRTANIPSPSRRISIMPRTPIRGAVFACAWGLACTLAEHSTSFLVRSYPHQCSRYSRHYRSFFFPPPRFPTVAERSSTSLSGTCFSHCPSLSSLHAYVFPSKGPVIARARHHLESCLSSGIRRWPRQDGFQQSPKRYMG
jgi:hypothetical protein